MIVAPLRSIYRCTLPAFSHGGRVHYLRSSCRRYATSHHVIVFCDPAPLRLFLVASLRDWGQSRPKGGGQCKKFMYSCVMHLITLLRYIRVCVYTYILIMYVRIFVVFA